MDLSPADKAGFDKILASLASLVTVWDNWFNDLEADSTEEFLEAAVNKAVA